LVRKLKEFERTGRGDLRHIAGRLYGLRIEEWRVLLGMKGGKGWILDFEWGHRAYHSELVERLAKRVGMLLP
jgi:hypothetical protein